MISSNMHGNDRDYLQDLLDRIQRIETFVENGHSEYAKSTLIQDAVQCNLGVMGEVTQQLSSDLRIQYPEVLWENMTRLRDVILHDYMELDLEKIWETVDRSLPQLKIQITQILQDLNSNH